MHAYQAKTKYNMKKKKKTCMVMSLIFFRLFIFNLNPFPCSSALHVYHSVKISEEHLEYHPIIPYHTMIKKSTRSIQVYDRES